MRCGAERCSRTSSPPWAPRVRTTTARRNFEELANTGANDTAQETLRRFASTYDLPPTAPKASSLALTMSSGLTRREQTQPTWENTFKWLRLERRRVAGAENVFAPLPSELITPFAAFQAASRQLHWALVIVTGAI